MRVEIKEIIESVFFDFQFRDLDREKWAKTLDNTRYASCEYLNDFIDFTIEINNSEDTCINDLSILIKEKNEEVGLWRMHYLKKVGINHQISYELIAYSPIFKVDYPAFLAKGMSKKCLIVANQIAKKLNICKWTSHDFFQNSVGLNPWYIESINHAAKITNLHDLYVNLQSSYSDIKSQIRNSYKSMLKLGKGYSIGVLSNSNNESIWQKFKDLHLEVAGRKTRSDQSWEMMHGSTLSGAAFLVYVLDEEEKMKAGSFFYMTVSECMYGVAAYSREDRKSNFGHVSLNIAIQEAQKRGILWCRLGPINFDFAAGNLNKKEQAIEFFKKGFSTDLMKRYKFAHNLVDYEGPLK